MGNADMSLSDRATVAVELGAIIDHMAAGFSAQAGNNVPDTAFCMVPGRPRMEAWIETLKAALALIPGGSEGHAIGTEDKQMIVRSIVENAMARLIDVGLDHDGAAALLVIQGTIRIKSPQKLKSVAEFVASSIPESD